MSRMYDKYGSFWMNEEELLASKTASILHGLEIIRVNMYKILKAP